MAASPELTGAAGSTYESEVVALYLADLLMGVGVRGLPSAVAQTVQVQRKGLGAPLDDLVVIGRREDGTDAQLHLQIKRKLVPSAASSNNDFRDVVHAAWATVTAPGFVVGRHRVGGAAEYVSSEKLRAARALARAAQEAHDGAELRTRLDTPGLFDHTSRDLGDAVCILIQECTARTPTPDEFWRFWKHFVIMQLETSDEPAGDKHDAIQRLRLAFPSSAGRALDIFDALVSVARKMATTAGSLDRSGLLERLDGRFSLNPSSVELGNTLSATTLAARKASLSDVNAFLRQRPHSLFLALGMHALAKDKATPVDQQEVVRFLRLREDVVLEGGPGAGKSTAVQQLAECLLAVAVELVPIVLPLQELASGLHSVIEEISRRAAFVSVGQTGLRDLASAGRLVLLMDGWNELPPKQRWRVQNEIGKFRRDHPLNPILLATRPETTPPPTLGSHAVPAHRVAMSALTTEQTLSLLSSILGRGAAKELDSLGSLPGMAEILEVPLYVRALAHGIADGSQPETREALLRGLAEAHERDPARASALAEVLFGRHADVLRHLATHMTAGSTTAIPEGEVRREISVVGRALEADGQIGAPFEPATVLNVLVAHHILVANGVSDSGRTLGFQHQQFQEWFASFAVADRLVAANVGDTKELKALDEALDNEAWTESLLFAVTRLSHGEPHERGAAARAILRCIGIDPMFAGRLIQVSTDDVWSRIAAPTLQFAKAWADSGQQGRALGFMLMTGRPEFADDVWRLFADANVYRETVQLDHRLDVRALGADVIGRLRSLPPDRWGQLLSDFALYGGRSGIELAVATASRGVASDVMVSLINALDLVGASVALRQLLSTASPDVWRQLAKGNFRLELDAVQSARLLEERVALADSLPPGSQRVMLRLALAELGAGDVSFEELAAEAVALELDVQGAQRVFSRLSTLDAGAFSRALLARTLRREPTAWGAHEFVLRADLGQQSALLELALDPTTTSAVRSVASSALDRPAVAVLIERYLAWRAGPQGGRVEDVVFEALDKVPLDYLVESVLEFSDQSPERIGALAWLIHRAWHGGANPKPLGLGDALKARLIAGVRLWVAELLRDVERSRGDLSEVAVVIERIADPALLPELVRLLDRELQSRRDQQAALRAGVFRDVRARSEAGSSYVLAYRSAFAAFEPDVVRETLLTYLGDAEFGEHAASLLRRSGGREELLRSNGPLFGAFDMETAALRRRNRAALRSSTGVPLPSSVAAAVLDQITRLLARGQVADRKRALSLATSVSEMECGDRLHEVSAAIEAYEHPLGRSSALRALLMAGESLPIEPVRAGLSLAIAELAAGRWTDQQWYLDEWFELAAFTLPASELLGALRTVPAAGLYPHRLRRLVVAIGHAGGANAASCLELLVELVPPLVEHHEWLSALAQLGSEAAARLFVDAVFNERTSTSLARTGVVVRPMGDLLVRYPQVCEELVRRLAKPHPETARVIVARLLPTMRAPELVGSFVDLVRSDLNDPIRIGLVRAVEKLALDERPIDGSPGVYALAPAGLSPLKRRLFDVVLSGTYRSSLAASMLTTIDTLRERYGRPAGERRHPNIETKEPWPEVASVAWRQVLADEGSYPQS